MPLVHVCAALARSPVTRRADRPIVGGLMHLRKPRRLERRMQVRWRHSKCLTPLKVVSSTYTSVCWWTADSNWVVARRDYWMKES